jgi:hypothetical protein
MIDRVHSFGKLLSILAVIAVAINAQCALSCTLQSATPSAHNCCKHHKAPQQQAQPILTASQTPHYIATPSASTFEVALLRSYYLSPPYHQPDIVPDLQFFSILRI